MKHVVPKVLQGLAPVLCGRCGSLMRLVGSEPHPVQANSDLLTYACTACDEFFVLPIEGPIAQG
jgi:hypothetical protein